ncbi:MAG: ribokinase [Bryobacteraceae bacterium]
MNPGIVVVGSLNMDFVINVDSLPAPGETVLGTNFAMIPGGKGANQANAAGRLAVSHRVKMVGRVGYDVFADHLKASLSAGGVDVSGVVATRAQPTGTAFIWVDRQGQNSIVVASGANHSLLPADLTSFGGAGYALFQLETPLPTVAAGLKLARREGVQTILDPAPAQHLPPDLLAAVDILTPNEGEAATLLGRKVSRISIAEAPALAAAVLELGARSVILKLGDQGCFYRDARTAMYAPAFGVEARDATAAGDTFNAALAVALAENQPIQTALRFANAAAAISVTRHGAQSSAPSRMEVEQMLQEQGLSG